METKTTAAKDVDGYIAGFPAEVQAVLEKVRETIRAAAPGAEETMAYQMPAFRLGGPLVYFGGFKEHVGFYPTPSGIEAFQEELAGYKGAKGSVQFPLDKAIPYELIGRITAFRVEENLAKGKGRKR
jgi:uncharacterized protein YdhG (YjbR/CyaY superfamily)